MSLGETREDYLDGLAGEWHCLSMWHMPFIQIIQKKCDITNQICLNEGVAIKQSSTYSGMRQIVGQWLLLSRYAGKIKIDYKKFVNRSDIAGGLYGGELCFQPACHKGG